VRFVLAEEEKWDPSGRPLSFKTCNREKKKGRTPGQLKAKVYSRRTNVYLGKIRRRGAYLVLDEVEREEKKGDA